MIFFITIVQFLFDESCEYNVHETMKAKYSLTNTNRP
jgi:hypothetical protein